ncbi:DUF4256 domain-containing protein [Sphingobacterium zeae]|uniref:DUF4256 domain-containing protein n=1 Tax=Sphingobacterium zeae TaxID=1776859 RepID=UPI0027D91D88|nr:DUF4256 domain-containing protein [Sphingobacterium zeae]
MKHSLAQEEQLLLLETLEKRFNKFTNRHPQISWNEVADKLRDNPQKLWSLHQMEKECR